MRNIVPRGWRTWLIIAGAAVLALLVAVIVLDAGLSAGRVHAGVSISVYKVGRMTRVQALQVIEAQVLKAQQSQITLTYGPQQWRVLPSNLEVQMDGAKSVDDAMAITRSGNVFTDLVTRFRLYFEPQNVTLTGALDQAAMDALMNKIARALDVAPVNAGLKIANSTIQVIESKDGMTVDKPILRDSLSQLLLTLHSTELPIPTLVVEPAIKANDTSEAVAKAESILASPVTMKSGEKKWMLTTQQLEAALDFTVEATAGDPGNVKLVPYISRTTTALFLADITEGVKKPGKDASWKVAGGKVTVLPSQNATALDVEGTLTALNTAAMSSTNRVAQVVLKEVPPALTTEKAKERGIEVPLGSFTTDNHGDWGRMQNVIKGSGLVDGFMLAPGQEFDYNKEVNSHNDEPGFWYLAPAIQADGTLKNEPGGGICQVSTTLFNAVFFTGLEVLERYNHSNYISSYPLGRDATVSVNGPNFRFRNDMNHWVMISTYADEAECTFTIYGKNEGRKVSYTTSDWSSSASGRSVTVVRTVALNSQVLHKDVFNSFFPFRVPPTTTTTTKPSTTTTTKPGPTTKTKPGQTTTTTQPPTSTTTTTQLPSTTTSTAPPPTNTGTS